MADLPRRLQWTLMVPPNAAVSIEAVRSTVDPVQWSLIAAHVTLCREDEIREIPAEVLAERLAGAMPITLALGRPEGFGGHGILLPCIRGRAEFRRMRERVLGSSAIREHPPHLTLAHPRNPRAVENGLAAASILPDGLEIEFDSVSLIEQEGGGPWRVLRTIRLGRRAGLAQRSGRC